MHLRATGDERWSALEKVLEIARAHRVSLIVIAGDFFSRQLDAHLLKVPLRKLMQSVDCPVVILPGNHDVLALSAGDDYGENVTVMASHETHLDIGDVRLFGLPFEKIVGERVLERLLSIKSRIRPAASNILLYHGELLDLSYSGKSFGDEERSGYMPVRLSFFDNLGLDYVLAGHFHSNFEAVRYSGGYFVYPGSPVSVTKKETGIRKVNLFEVGEPPRAEIVNSFHYRDVDVYLNPFSMKDPLETIERETRGSHPDARIQLTVSGFVDLEMLGKTEKEFSAAVRSRLSSRVDLVSAQWRDISSVRRNGLFIRFLEKLEAAGQPEGVKRELRRLAMESMMEASVAD